MREMALRHILHRLNAAELKRPTMNAQVDLWNEKAVYVRRYSGRSLA